MLFTRILVDGYSLLHAWKELAAGKPRHSRAARDALIHVLIQYRDAIRTPISVFFDGTDQTGEHPRPSSTREFEIIYSKSGQTADQLIERVATRLVAYGEVLVVTNDHAESNTVLAVGAHIHRCESFALDIQRELADMQSDLRDFNRRELKRFKESGR